MDWHSLGGIAIAIVSVMAGHWMENGSVSSLFQPTAFVIVLCGTLGAVMLQSKREVFITSIKSVKQVFFYERENLLDIASKLKTFSAIAKSKNLFALQNYVETESNIFLKKGIRLISDGISGEKIESILKNDIYQYETKQFALVKVWESAGGYAPTLGILGAVLGLVHVMENLSDPAKLGAGIAVAFVATIYGVGLANLVFIPIANKLKAITQDGVDMREMVLDGVLSIRYGEHVYLMQERIEEYLK